VDRFKSQPINEAGLYLQEKFTYSKMVDSILEKLSKI